MSEQTFLSADPGIETGIGIFNSNGALLTNGVIKDRSTIREYLEQLQAVKEKWNVRFALIEEYQNFGKARVNAHKVYAQIRALQDVFQNHVMVYTVQWNPRHLSDRHKKNVWFPAVFNRIAVDSGHAIDACLMGSVIFGKTRERASGKPFESLEYIALTSKRFPKQSETSPWSYGEYFDWLKIKNDLSDRRVSA